MTTQLITTYNTLRTALDLGQMVSPHAPNGTVVNRFIDGSITTHNRVDYYRFVLQKPATLRIEPQNFTRHVHFRLIHDAKAKYRIASGDIILERNNSSAAPLQIDGLGVGVYYLEVTGIDQAAANYSLKLSATVGAARLPVSKLGNTLNDPMLIVGQLNGKRAFENSLDSVLQATHIYQFTLTQAVRLRAVLSSVKAEAQLYLYRAVMGGTQFSQHEEVATAISNGMVPCELSHDILVPGTYYLRVINRSGQRLDYNLELQATPVLSARMRVNIHELRALAIFDARVPFTNWHEADFFGTVIIDGYTHRFGPFPDQDMVRNLNFSQVVYDPNQRFIRVKIEVNDEDNGSHDRADLAPVFGVQFLRFDYDTLKQQIIGLEGFGGRYPADRIIELNGTGNDWVQDKPRLAASHAAAIKFGVSYTPLI